MEFGGLHLMVKTLAEILRSGTWRANQTSARESLTRHACESLHFQDDFGMKTMRSWELSCMPLCVQFFPLSIITVDNENKSCVRYI